VADAGNRRRKRIERGLEMLIRELLEVVPGTVPVRIYDVWEAGKPLVPLLYTDNLNWDDLPFGSDAKVWFVSAGVTDDDTPRLNITTESKSNIFKTAEV
jgi:hypothetical protein